MLPFIDGGAGVSLVASHCLTDGVGLCEAVADAAGGYDNAMELACCRVTPALAGPAGGRPPNRAGHPEIGRAVAAAARFVRHNFGRAGSATPTPAPAAGADERITVPTATIFVDADEWDARAHSLGGTSNTLLEALAARLAQRVGRVTADGSVTLTMPVNQRTAGDTRANAITNVDITVDPAPATTDLREIRQQQSKH